jgi:hypothetical protein
MTLLVQGKEHELEILLEFATFETAPAAVVVYVKECMSEIFVSAVLIPVFVALLR